MDKDKRKNNISAQMGPLLSQVSRLWDSRINFCLASTSLTRAHWAILARLIEADSPTNQGDLAIWSGVEPSALTGPLEHLERLGYIERITHPKDRRAKLITIRAEARGRLVEIEKVVAELRSKLFRTIPEADISKTIKTLQTVRDTLFQVPSQAVSKKEKDHNDSLQIQDYGEF